MQTARTVPPGEIVGTADQRIIMHGVRWDQFEVLDADAVLCSDSNAIYHCFAERAHIAHTPVNLKAGIRVIDHAFHIQNANAYHRRLKGWMARFHGVATKYLPNYLGWLRCLERFAATLTPALMLSLAIGRNQHLTQT
jgi:hypothetical protein